MYISTISAWKTRTNKTNQLPLFSKLPQTIQTPSKEGNPAYFSIISFISPTISSNSESVKTAQFNPENSNRSSQKDRSGSPGKKRFEFVGSLNKAVRGFTNLAKDVAGGVTNLTKNVAGGVTNLAKDVAGGVTNLAKDVAGGVTNLAKDVAGGVKDAVVGVKDAVLMSNIIFTWK